MRSSGRARSAPWIFNLSRVQADLARKWRSGFKNDPRLTWRRLGRLAQNDSRSHGRSVWLAGGPALTRGVPLSPRLSIVQTDYPCATNRDTGGILYLVLHHISPHQRSPHPSLHISNLSPGTPLLARRSESQLSGPYRAHSYASHSLYCFGSQLTSHLVPRVLTQETIIFLTPPGQHRDTVAQACIVRHPLNLLYHPSFLTNTSHYIVLLQSRDGRGFRY